MTIHGAKGLQFPIVVCSGTTTQASPRLGGVQVLFPATGGYEVSLSKRAHTDAFELHQAFDEQMSFHEKLRLLYVACTRVVITSSSPSIAPNARTRPIPAV